MKTRFRASKEEIMDYLEYKIKADEATSTEYCLYIEWNTYGNKILDKYKRVLRSLVQQIKIEYSYI